MIETRITNGMADAILRGFKNVRFRYGQDAWAELMQIPFMQIPSMSNKAASPPVIWFHGAHHIEDSTLKPDEIIVEDVP